MKKPVESTADTASEHITNRIAELGDWRGKTLDRMRKLIHEEDPAVVEEWKWMGTPVWSHNGIITTGEAYKAIVKLTFAKGASLRDPARLFNSSLDGNVRRAIDIKEGETIDATAFKALVREAITLNASKVKAPKKSAAKTVANAGKTSVTSAKVVTKKAAKKVAKKVAKKIAKKVTTQPAKKTTKKTVGKTK